MDDAAGLAVSEGMKSRIRGLGMAERNALDGVSVVQTAEGSMAEISDIIIRMRELTVQSANDSITDTERGYLSLEFTELSEEIDRISQATKHNGMSLLDGSLGGGLDFQVGHDSGAANRINVSFADTTLTGLGLGGAAGVGTKANALTTMDDLDAALDTLNTGRALLGSRGNRLQIAASAVATQRENLSAANSRIRDVDIARESSELARNQILLQAAVAMKVQANQGPQLLLALLG